MIIIKCLGEGKDTYNNIIKTVKKSCPNTGDRWSIVTTVFGEDDIVIPADVGIYNYTTINLILKQIIIYIITYYIYYLYYLYSNNDSEPNSG